MNLFVVASVLVTYFELCHGLRETGRNIKLTHADRAMLLSYHNDLRREVKAANMQEMSWDREAARAARKWGRLCNYDRPRNDGYGENLFYNFRDNKEPVNEVMMDALGVWSREKNAYTLYSDCVRTRTCDYLKMVNAHVESVGCAVTKCQVLKTGKHRREYDVNFVTCFYTPFIDVSRTNPYILGKPCTYCRQGYDCRRNLCTPPMIPMNGLTINFGPAYDAERKLKENNMQTNEIPSKGTEETQQNTIPQVINRKPYENTGGQQAELRTGTSKVRLFSGSNEIGKLREEETPRVKRQTRRYNSYDRYAAERQRRRLAEERRRQEYEMRLRRQEEERRRQLEDQRRRERQRQRRRQGQRAGAVELRQGAPLTEVIVPIDPYAEERRLRNLERELYAKIIKIRKQHLALTAQRLKKEKEANEKGELSDNDEYYLLQMHNNYRPTGIPKLEWSSRLERWAKYVIRCDVEYPGPAYCFTNFGKVNSDQPVYQIVTDWNNEGSNLFQELKTGCRTPYDRSQCNHHVIINDRDIREMACASLNCQSQRQVTCIYQ